MTTPAPRGTLKIGSNMYQGNVEGGIVLFSYQTPVAAIINSHAFVTEEFHSRTTSAHIRKWLQSLRPYQPFIRKPQAYFYDLVKGE